MLRARRVCWWCQRARAWWRRLRSSRCTLWPDGVGWERRRAISTMVSGIVLGLTDRGLPNWVRAGSSAKPLMDAARRISQLKRGEHDDPPLSGLANAAGSQGREMVEASTISSDQPDWLGCAHRHPYAFHGLLRYERALPQLRGQGSAAPPPSRPLPWLLWCSASFPSARTGCKTDRRRRCS